MYHNRNGKEKKKTLYAKKTAVQPLDLFKKPSRPSSSNVKGDTGKGTREAI